MNESIASVKECEMIRMEGESGEGEVPKWTLCVLYLKQRVSVIVNIIDVVGDDFVLPGRISIDDGTILHRVSEAIDDSIEVGVTRQLERAETGMGHRQHFVDIADVARRIVILNLEIGIPKSLF